MWPKSSIIIIQSVNLDPWFVFNECIYLGIHFFFSICSASGVVGFGDPSANLVFQHFVQSSSIFIFHIIVSNCSTLFSFCFIHETIYVFINIESVHKLGVAYILKHFQEKTMARSLAYVTFNASLKEACFRASPASAEFPWMAKEPGRVTWCWTQ